MYIHDHVRPLHEPDSSLSPDAFNSLFVVSPPTHRRAPSLPYERHTPIHDQVPLVVALHGSPKPIVPRGAYRVAIGPMQVGIGPDHVYVRKDFYFAFCTFYFISFCFRPAALYSEIPSYFGPFTISDTAPLTPLYLYIHPSALDPISVNLSLFRSLHPLTIVTARVCRRQARIWFPLFPLLDFLVFILP